ncbi:MAG TPA: arginine deiminase family protein [Saprospiraceae bacterium]|nr:arginine deiminase family protein [Saprospiraceae bacterium]
MYKYAIVRDIPDSFAQCVTSFVSTNPIDVALARHQHQLYCNTLERLGLKLIRIEADNTLPDCCFVEDTAIVLDELAIISNLGLASRVSEIKAMEIALIPYKNLKHIIPPGTLEGGDVLRIDKQVYIGISARTNEDGINQVKEILHSLEYTVHPIKIKGTLHLKSVVTYLGNNTIILAEGHLEDSVFSTYEKIITPMNEAYCANCLLINEKVLVPKGYPASKSLIEEKGFELIELDMSEFEKADGALTCKSILF